MMRFQNDQDRNSLLSELGYPADTDLDKLPENELHEFIKRRSGLIRGAKNQAVSKQVKRSWKKNRKNHMKGIKKFHKSTAGKRMHRQIGRFLATRITKRSVKSTRMLRESLLKAISSLRTHLYIENETYQTVNDQRDLGLLMDHAVPALLEIEQRWWSVSNGDLLVETDAMPLDEDEFELLMCLTHPNAIQAALFERGFAESKIKVVQEALHHCTMSENEVSFESVLQDTCTL
jgi:hypothetical protein